jgi:zinc transport system substrate-binding protein
MSQVLLALLGCALFVSACAESPDQATQEPAAPAAAQRPTAAAIEPLTVYTVNYPLAYFAARIGGDRVRVEFPAPPDGDPANWAPGAEDIVAYQQADLILLNGAGYAGWTRMVTLPEDKLVDTSASFADRYISEDSASHSHGPDGEHSHEAEIAFTTWLDPQLAIEQARAIRDALSARQPDSAAEFQAGFESLQADLSALDRDFEALFGELGDAPVVFSHPVYQYLQRRYGIDGVSVHWEPGERPGNDELMKLADRLVSHPAQLMVWEGEPVPESVAALSAMTVDSVVLDPCGNRPGEGDYLTVMRDNVANLRAAISD